MRTIDTIKAAIHNKILRQNSSVPLLEELKKTGRITDIVSLLGSVFLKREEETVRHFMADVFAGEILEIADHANDNEEGLGKDDLARAKLRIDTRKWLMSHFAPGRYGDGSAANDAPKRSIFAPRLYLPDNGRN
ncbi:MAG: hypothetical protein EP348_06035 [Alphaproteobacteria bacterium]|nr:MAG: hypothetical protein EP348_06035 [Alphaproteobacteria bacterium]